MSRTVFLITMLQIVYLAGCGPIQDTIAAVGGVAGAGAAAVPSTSGSTGFLAPKNNPPIITNLMGPENGSSDLTPSFSWIGTDTDGSIDSYLIELDSVSYGSTTMTAWTSQKLNSGSHVFSVAAIDSAGEASDPEDWYWVIAFDCASVTVPQTVVIANSLYAMGDGYGIGDTDEIPVHAVSLSEFGICINEITTRQFAEFLNAGNGEYYYPAPDQAIVELAGGEYIPLPGREDHPAVYVSWEAANAYCEFLCWITGDTWRLPTEAEWEYAALGGQDGRLYPTGAAIDGTMANFRDSGDPFEIGNLSWTTPVGYFNATGYGLYDMAGNVWEWCLDYYAD
ncbi:MAG: hypothetical protein E3J72_04270, partial [Planctomycetota bacterium]